MTDGAGGTLAIDKDRFLLLYVLTNAASRNTRLASIAELLKAVVRSARTVVKGTDSQRRFNAQLAEFCRALVLTLPEVEDAVFELTHPGHRAAEATDDEVQGITEGTLLKELAAYLATQTSSLGARYLEHIALSSLQGAGVTHGAPDSGVTATSALLGGKRERVLATVTSRAATAMASDVSSQGVRPRRAKCYAGATAAGRVATGTSGVVEEHDALGLLDEDDMARAARRQLRLDDQITLSNAAQEQPQRRERGLFVSDKAGVGGGRAAAPERGTMGASRVFDLRQPGQKLSFIPELLPRLQPWTIPVPLSGIMIDRLTTERERRGATAAAVPCLPGQGTMPPVGVHVARASTAPREGKPSHATPVLTVVDACLATNPTELLRAWERREAALAVCRAQAIGDDDVYLDGGVADATSVTDAAAYVPADHRVPLHPAQDSGNTTSSPPLHPSTAPALRPSMTNVPGMSDFFPRLPQHDGSATASVPTSLMTNLVHFGVASIEFT